MRSVSRGGQFILGAGGAGGKGSRITDHGARCDGGSRTSFVANIVSVNRSFPRALVSALRVEAYSICHVHGGRGGNK